MIVISNLLLLLAVSKLSPRDLPKTDTTRRYPCLSRRVTRRRAWWVAVVVASRDLRVSLPPKRKTLNTNINIIVLSHHYLAHSCDGASKYQRGAIGFTSESHGVLVV